jgi:hypothetical protein
MVRARRTSLAAGVLAALALTIGSVAAARAAVQGPTPGTAATGTATVSGLVTQAGGARLPGMRVQAQVVGTAPASCAPAAGCFTAYAGPAGRYLLSRLAPATYELSVLDGARTVDVRRLTVAAGTSAVTAPLRLGPASVPAGTEASHARRDLTWLRAERARDGMPSDVVLNPRWSQECAAHDDYEAAGGVLQSSEDPAAAGASVGGAWAGLNSDLAEGRWTARGTPWEQAPIHLLALLAPSLRVTGIDDSRTFQCAVTFPGMVRRWSRPDAVGTVPARGATGVPPAELARESPFTPVQFVGLPPSRRTGRELFVYLNRTGTLGQAPVRITHAWLRARGRRTAVRWVDSATRTVGAYLAGGILIPLRPLARRTTYRASVTVLDGARALTHMWRFTTR